jgi:hypothetical protein
MRHRFTPAILSSTTLAGIGRIEAATAVRTIQ